MIDLGESRADALVFLRGLFSDLGCEERIEVRVLNQGKTKTWMCDSPERVVSAIEKGVQDGENVYFGVLPRRRGVKSGKREDVTAGTAAWIDLDADISAAEAKARVSKYPVKPSYVVKSGHGYHVYWLLSERVTCEDLGKLEQLNRAIAEITGADAACYDAARILRMPGTKNWKHEEPRDCKFVGKPTLKPARHTLAELAAAAAVFGGAAAEPNTCSSASGTKGNGWGGVPQGQRNNELFRKACDLRERRVPEDLALGALKEWNRKNHPPLPDDEVTQTVKRVYTPGLPLGGGTVAGDQGAPPSEIDPYACLTPADLISEAPEEVDFTVDGLVPTSGVTIFSGEGGIGKSFIALDLAMAVASGTAFADRFPCQAGPVIYVDLENDEGTIGRRLKRLGMGRGIDPTRLPLYLPQRGTPGVELQQDTPEGRAWLWTVIQKYRPRLVVIDSLIACHSGDENNNVLMRQLVSGLDGMARAGEMGLLVVHHQRKRGTNNDAGQLMRGASDLRNSVVSHFAARRSTDDVVLCVHDKCRPTQPAKPFSLTIRDLDSQAVRIELVGGSDEQPGGSHAEREARVIAALREHGPRTPAQLYEAIGSGERTCQRTLYKMARQGLILKWPDGMYRLCDDTTGRGGEPDAEKNADASE